MGRVFKVPALLVYFGGGLLGLFVSLRIISAELGFWGMVAALFLFPIVVYLTPWYAAVAYGNWGVTGAY